VIAGRFQYRPVADRRQLELHGMRTAARRSNTVVTEPQRQRLPIHIEYPGPSEQRVGLAIEQCFGDEQRMVLAPRWGG
jgi:hypothetical protein